MSFSTLATQDSEPVPDMALLEYLAELVEVDGELVGPIDMQQDVEEETVQPIDEQVTDEDKIDGRQPPTDDNRQSNDERPIEGALQ